MDPAADAVRRFDQVNVYARVVFDVQRGARAARRSAAGRRREPTGEHRLRARRRRGRLTSPANNRQKHVTVSTSSGSSGNDAAERHNHVVFVQPPVPERVPEEQPRREVPERRLADRVPLVAERTSRPCRRTTACPPRIGRSSSAFGTSRSAATCRVGGGRAGSKCSRGRGGRARPAGSCRAGANTQYWSTVAEMADDTLRVHTAPTRWAASALRVGQRSGARRASGARWAQPRAHARTAASGNDAVNWCVVLSARDAWTSGPRLDGCRRSCGSATAHDLVFDCFGTATRPPATSTPLRCQRASRCAVVGPRPGANIGVEAGRGRGIDVDAADHHVVQLEDAHVHETHHASKSARWRSRSPRFSDKGIEQGAICSGETGRRTNVLDAWRGSPHGVVGRIVSRSERDQPEFLADQRHCAVRVTRMRPARTG